jgi:signal transduction histidine kinase
MYTEMLAGGMVKDEQRRREYLATLRGESSRLAQLVENVLSYARLERNRATTHAEETTVGAMIDRFADRLRQRTDQAGMELAVELDDAACDAVLRTDVSAVEQIVFNLVDNACKYASQAEDRRIHLQGKVDTHRLRLTVVDHASGVDEDVARRLFKPFSKSAKAAANSAPGVGLGLALSRRLARRLGGDLRLVRSDRNGCRFELSLPRP